MASKCKLSLIDRGYFAYMSMNLRVYVMDACNARTIASALPTLPPLETVNFPEFWVLTTLLITEPHYCLRAVLLGCDLYKVESQQSCSRIWAKYFLLRSTSLKNVLISSLKNNNKNICSCVMFCVVQFNSSAITCFHNNNNKWEITDRWRIG